MTRYFLDFEFLEDGKTIEPISLGMVSERGAQLYIEFDFDESRAQAHPWLAQHVLPKLVKPKKFRLNREQAKEEILEFVPRVPFSEDRPVFWAYFADYDWVVLCQIFGTMTDLPGHFPQFCLDLQQWWYQLGYPAGVKPSEPKGEHNALEDANWNYRFYTALADYTKKCVGP